MSSIADKVAVAIVAAAREVGGDGWQQVAFDVAGGKTVLGGHDYSVPRARAYAAHSLNLMTDWPRASIVNMVGGRGHPDQFFGNIKVMRSKAFWDDAIVDRVTLAIFAVQTPVSSFAASNEEEKTDMPAEPVPAPQFLPRPAVTPGKRSAIELLRQAVENTQRMTPPEDAQP